jgi:hypothetical protein
MPVYESQNGDRFTYDEDTGDVKPVENDSADATAGAQNPAGANAGVLGAPTAETVSQTPVGGGTAPEIDVDGEKYTPTSETNADGMPVYESQTGDRFTYDEATGDVKPVENDSADATAGAQNPAGTNAGVLGAPTAETVSQTPVGGGTAPEIEVDGEKYTPTSETNADGMPVYESQTGERFTYDEANGEVRSIESEETEASAFNKSHLSAGGKQPDAQMPMDAYSDMVDSEQMPQSFETADGQVFSYQGVLGSVDDPLGHIYADPDGNAFYNSGHDSDMTHYGDLSDIEYEKVN